MSITKRPVRHRAATMAVTPAMLANIRYTNPVWVDVDLKRATPDCEKPATQPVHDGGAGMMGVGQWNTHKGSTVVAGWPKVEKS